MTAPSLVLLGNGSDDPGNTTGVDLIVSAAWSLLTIAVTRNCIYCVGLITIYLPIAMVVVIQCHHCHRQMENCHHDKLDADLNP